MKCSRLHVYFVLSATVRSTTSFLVTRARTATGVFTGIGDVCRSSSWSSRSSATCPNTGASRSRTRLRMGSARKKKRKLENEGSKVAGGGSAQSSGVQVEAERIAEGLLEKCGESKRDMGEISAAIENLRSLSTTLRPAQSLDLNDDWRLVFANDDDAMCAVGTGLHKLPLTRMQDFFLTLSGSSSLRRIQAIEVLRVLGPFPNLRNTLTGQCKSTSPKSLNIRYTSMVDGTGKKTGSSFTGEQDRVIDVSVAFVGQKALVLNTFDSEKKVEIKEGSLVFVRESDLDLALAELRVDGVEQK